MYGDAVRGRLSWRATEHALILTFAVFALVFVWRASAVIDGHRTFSLFDDAMISMRYGRNLVDGHGLVFNNGQHVEGYTNLLWTLVMAGVQVVVPGRRFSAGAVSLLSASLLVAQLYVVRAFTRRLTDLPFAPLVAIAGTACSFTLVFWALRGMEVGLLALLVVSAAFAVARVMQEGLDRRGGLLIAFLLTLVLFTRDDAAVPCAVMLAFLIAGVDRERRKRTAAVAAAGAVAVVGARLALRLALYGHLVPNTYVLKIQGIPKHLLLQRGLLGLGYVLGFGLAVPVALGLIAISRADTRPVRLALMMLATIVVAQLAYSVAVGGDAWEDAGFANRFLATVIGPLSILVAIGVANLARGRVHRRAGLLALVPITGSIVFVVVAPRFTRYYQLGDKAARSGFHDTVRLLFLVAAATVLCAAMLRRSARPALAAVLALLAVAAPNVLPIASWTRHNQPFQTSETAWARYGERLAAATQPNARIAASSIGNIGYFSQRPIVDELGKIDEHVARTPPRTSFWVLPGHWRWDYRYSVVTLRPDVVAELFGPSKADEQMIEAAGYDVVPTPSGHGPVYVRANSALVDRSKLRYAAEVAR
jgi:arabinofuranosyltransferase